MSRGRIRAVIIGCGQIAGGYDMPKNRSRGKIRTHIKAYLSDPRFEVTAVCDKDRRRAERFRRHWGVPRAYTDAGKMLRAERPGIVSVCTPTPAHAKILAEIARHPVKLVFAEKPLTSSPKEARRVAALLKGKRIKIAVNYLRRWCPNHGRLKKIIESGRLGRLRCVDAYYAGDLLNIGSHLIDLIGFLASPVAAVRGGGELKLKNGITGVLERGKKDDFILELLFERGFVKISRYGYNGTCSVWRRKGLKLLFRFAAPAKGIDRAMAEAMRNMAENLRGKEALLSGAANAIDVLQTCQAIEASRRKKGKWVRAV